MKNNQFIDSLDVQTMKGVYEKIIAARDALYAEIAGNDPARLALLKALKRHNDIVFYYAVKLIMAQGLGTKETLAAYVAVILHDAEKMDKDLLKHHVPEHALWIMLKFQGVWFNGTMFDQEIMEMALAAIRRHMNHPFLVKMNGGNKFPLPENSVDRIVYSADMMANIGFKNIAYRLNEKFGPEDREAAREKGITQLQAAFENVLAGVLSLQKDIEAIQEGMLTQEAEKLMETHVNNVHNIAWALQKENSFGDNVFDIIHKKLKSNAVDAGNSERAVELLNAEIRKIGNRFRIPEEYYQCYLM